MLKRLFSIDFARKILLPGRPAEETRVQDIMTEEVKGLEKWKIILFEHYHSIFPSLIISFTIFQDKLITVSSRTNILRAMEVMTGNESFNYFVKRVDCIKFVSYWKT